MVFAITFGIGATLLPSDIGPALDSVVFSNDLVLNADSYTSFLGVRRQSYLVQSPLSPNRPTAQLVVPATGILCVLCILGHLHDMEAVKPHIPWYESTVVRIFELGHFV